MQKLIKLSLIILISSLILNIQSCRFTRDNSKYPQRYPQEAHISIIKALSKKDYEYFRKYLIRSEEREFWEKAETMFYDSLLNFLKAIETKHVEVFGNSKEASIHGDQGSAVYHLIWGNWYFVTGFNKNDIEGSEIDTVRDAFEVTGENDVIKAPTKKSYLIKTDNLIIKFKLSDMKIEHNSIKVKDKYLNYTEESSDIQFTLYNNEFEKLCTEIKHVSNGSWSPYSKLPYDIIKELLPFEPKVDIDGFSLWLSYHSVESWWISFSKDCEVAAISDTFDVNELNLKGVVFKKVYGDLHLEDCN